MKEIQLIGGKVTIVDDEDYDRLMAIGKWRLNIGGYVVRSIAYKNSFGKWCNKSVRMHRIIMNAPDDMQVDHRWGDKLDNRKENLRLCTRTENQRNKGIPRNNTSGFKGVTWNKKMRKWKAAIKVNSKQIYLGQFSCPIKAAHAYNDAALSHFGEFASLNTIPENYIVDNQKMNLLLEIRINSASGFRGVFWSKESGKWRARINVNFKQIYLGYFDCPIEAAKAYNAAVLKYRGESARLNPIPKESNSSSQIQQQ